MITQTPTRTCFSIARICLYWTMIVCASMLVLVLFCQVSGVGGHGPAKVERLLTGTADRPYIYRALLPTVANWLSPWVDPGLAQRIGQISDRLLGDGFFSRRLNGAEYPSQVLIILGIMFLSLIGFGAVAGGMLRSLGYVGWVSDFGPTALVLGVTPFIRFGYIYDFTTLFLFTLALWLMFREQWWHYLAVLGLATLNKETTIFLTLIFALCYASRLPRQKFAALTAAQVAIYAVVQGMVRYFYRNNPGVAVQWHLPDHIAAILRDLASTPHHVLAVSLAVVSISALVAYGWRKKSVRLRTALSVLPLFVVLFLLWGYPGEIRVMLEMYPIVALMTLPPQLLQQAPP